MNGLIRLVVGTAVLAVSVAAGAQALYQDESAPVDARVADLIGRLTTEEKVGLLRATSPAIPRLGIDKYYHGNEALHGVVRPGRFTVFPQAVGLAATWNTDLIYSVATAISDEARARWNELDQGREQTEQFTDLLTFWSPTVNMARDPRWGRTPETYGEDPVLSGAMGAAFVRGLQGDNPRYLKIVSTPKHFAANNEEHNRFSCLPQLTEKQLREYYLPAFEQCVTKGKAASVMAAYNAVFDVPCAANPWLLTKVLRDDWGFDGYVVSDCGGVAAVRNAHKYCKTLETAGALCLKAGLDLECGDEVYDEPLLRAYRLGMVTDADIDTAATRVLRARMRLGIFDSGKDNPYARIPASVIGSAEHQRIALEAARQSIVLLKNSGSTLPLDSKKIKTIGVVGVNADKAEFGDYSGMPVVAPVSVLQGIRDRAGKDVRVLHAPWKSAKDGLEIIDERSFPEGVKAEYFSNMNLEGTPRVRHEKWVNYEPANQAPDPFLPGNPVSVRWTGKLRPPVSGEYVMTFTSDDGARLYIDDKLLVDSWGGHAVRTDSASVYLEAGRDYNLRAEYWDNRDYAIARLQWRVPSAPASTRLDMFGEAGDVARKSDVVVAVMGINKSIEREGQDRYDISLPDDQREFLREIYKVNRNIVLVVVAGSNLALNWEDNNLPAIVDAWYGGESGGRAVAEVLFGDYNPGGRLPLTFYRSLEDLPAFDDYDITKGRTYKYFTGDVVYPFGHGLSYSTFRYDNLRVEDAGDSVLVSFDLSNTGCYDGDEVAQVYMRMPEYGCAIVLLKELKGFRRVSVARGKRERVAIAVPKSSLRYWDETTGGFVTVPSSLYDVFVGSSSADIRLQTAIAI